MLVNASALAAHLGLSRQRVVQLTEEGVLARDPGGKFDQDACRAAYIGYLRDAAKRTAPNPEVARLQAAKARAVELRMAREEGELIPADDATDAMAEVVGMLILRMQGLPARITRDPALRLKIEAELDAIRSAVADDLEKSDIELLAKNANRSVHNAEMIVNRLLQLERNSDLIKRYWQFFPTVTEIDMADSVAAARHIRGLIRRLIRAPA